MLSPLCSHALRSGEPATRFARPHDAPLTAGFFFFFFSNAPSSPRSCGQRGEFRSSRVNAVRNLDDSPRGRMFKKGGLKYAANISRRANNAVVETLAGRGFNPSYPSTLKSTPASNYRAAPPGRLGYRETSSSRRESADHFGWVWGEGQGGGREKRRPKSFPARGGRGWGWTGLGRRGDARGEGCDEATPPPPPPLAARQEIRERGTRTRVGAERREGGGGVVAG